MVGKRLELRGEPIVASDEVGQVGIGSRKVGVERSVAVGERSQVLTVVRGVEHPTDRPPHAQLDPLLRLAFVSLASPLVPYTTIVLSPRSAAFADVAPVRMHSSSGRAWRNRIEDGGVGTLRICEVATKVRRWVFDVFG
jgi:hypothetical protein